MRELPGGLSPLTDEDVERRRLELEMEPHKLAFARIERAMSIWRAEGSWPGAAEKARPEPRADAGHGPAEPDAEPDGENGS